MLASGFNDDPTSLWEPHLSPKFPYEIRKAVLDPTVTKVAWNSTFERAVLRKFYNIESPCNQWIDPMVWARHLSMPGKLESVGEILKLDVTEAKMEEGARLIQKFCQPQNDVMESPLFGTSTAFYRDWETDPDDWFLFGKYCQQDVVAERTILHKLRKFPLPTLEQKGWELDQKINERGMPVDLDLVRGALKLAVQEVVGLNQELKEITGLENPNSRDQMLAWLRPQGYPFNSLGKDEVTRVLNTPSILGVMTPEAQKALYIRQKASKTSYKKYEAILTNVGADGRLRDQFSFLGASRAGRWTGHAVQLQNLPRPTKAVEKKLDRAIDLLREIGQAQTEVLSAYIDQVNKEFPSVMDVVSSCIRSAFRAPEGKKLVVCDLNAIENRVLGWVARSKTILAVFEEGRCPYLDFASKMYDIPYAELAAAYESGDPSAKEKRQVAKPAVLGCGYGLGGGEEYQDKNGDWVKGGLWGYAEGMGIKVTQEQAHDAVKIWRDENPEVVQLWYDLEAAAIRAVKTGEAVRVGPVTFQCFGGKVLRILLPSGRGLHYIHPRIEGREFQGRKGPYVRESLYYDGIDQQTRQWVRVPTYGGKLTENIVQAISRDLLLNAMFLADEMGFNIVAHVHDEIVTEVADDSRIGLKDLRDCMVTRPEWARDLPLGAEGYECVYYHK